jgi:carboxypeptidase Taq
VISAPTELAVLRGRLQEIADLQGIVQLLRWDQATMMPPAGARVRAERSATLDSALHEKLVDPALGRLLDRLEPWAAGEDPDDDDVRLVAWARRDHEKAACVPTELSADLSRAAALGQAAWLDAREHADFSRFSGALERHLELRHRYVGCFENVEHPYDVLLDDFEPGMRTSEVVSLFAALRRGLAPLVSATARDDRPRNDGVLDGPFGVPAQRAAIEDMLDGLGFDSGAWRLDPAPHPFASGVGRGDTRITLRYDEHDFGMALYSALHEFGHGLYAAGTDPRLDRTTLDRPVSLGVHESQSRMWENLVGRSRPFCEWLLPRLRSTLGDGLAVPDPDALFKAINQVSRSLIRVEADETTYNLHVVLRFELEIELLEGRLSVSDLPEAWNARMAQDLGVDVPDDSVGVLQDTHWGIGAIGYFARTPSATSWPPSCGSASGRTFPISTSRSLAASSMRCRSGSASTSTATAASLPSGSCSTG